MSNDQKIRELKDKIELLTVVAIPREQEAFNFYINLANKSSEETIKQTFANLAKEEMAHKQKLDQLLEEAMKELDLLQSQS